MKTIEYEDSNLIVNLFVKTKIMIDKSYEISILEKDVSELRKASERLVEVSVLLPDEMMYSLNDTYEVCYRHYMMHGERKSSEKKYQNYIIENFSEVFNGKYNYIGQEVTLKGIGRIDILAECEESKRPVVIELKTNGNNPTRQLLAYATEYQNPILVGISDRKINNKHEDIQYHTYSSLNINQEAI